MKKKNLIALVVLVVLALLAGLSIFQQRNTNTLASTEAQFAVVDTASIDRIFIADKNGSTVNLERTQGFYWRGDGRYKVDPVQIGLILNTLHDVAVRRPCTPAEREEVIKDLAGRHQKVEVYRKGQLIRTFYVGSETNDAEGTYFLAEGSENPFVVHLPSFRGILNTRFAFRESAFRFKQVFLSPPGMLKKAVFEFPQLGPQSGFTVQGMGNYYGIEGIAEPDTARLLQLISAFSKALYTEDASTYEKTSLDSALAASQVHLRITVTDSLPENNNSLEVLEELTSEKEFVLARTGPQGLPVTLYVPNYLVFAHPRSYYLRPGQQPAP